MRIYTKDDVVGVSSHYDSGGDRYIYTYYITDPSIKGSTSLSFESIANYAWENHRIRFGASDYTPTDFWRGYVSVGFNYNDTPQEDNSTVRDSFVLYVEFPENILA